MKPAKTNNPRDKDTTSSDHNICSGENKSLFVSLTVTCDQLPLAALHSHGSLVKNRFRISSRWKDRSKQTDEKLKSAKWTNVVGKAFGSTFTTSER